MSHSAFYLGHCPSCEHLPPSRSDRLGPVYTLLGPAPTPPRHTAHLGHWDSGTRGPSCCSFHSIVSTCCVASWGCLPSPSFLLPGPYLPGSPTDLMLHSPAPLQPKLHITLALLSVHVQTGTIPVGMRPREHATPTRVPQATLHPPYHSDSHPIWPQVLLI